jgi:hypothetical protein
MEKLGKEGFYGFTCRPKALLSVLTFQVPESNDNPSFFDSLMVPKRVNDLFFCFILGQQNFKTNLWQLYLNTLPS